MSTLDDLERLAKAATPGPWRAILGTVYPEGRQPGWSPLPVGEGVAIDARWPILAGENHVADAAYIAALDPTTVLDLVAKARSWDRHVASAMERGQVEAEAVLAEYRADLIAKARLGEAWARAEAALPSGGWTLSLTSNPSGRWTATAFTRLHGRVHRKVTMDRYPSDTTALDALAEKLEQGQ